MIMGTQTSQYTILCDFHVNSKFPTLIDGKIQHESKDIEFDYAVIGYVLSELGSN